MMSKPFLLVFLMLLIVFTSQLEWSQQIVNEVDEASPTISQRQLYLSKREESVKEKIILSQEKNIQKLNKLVRTLEEQLLQCRGNIKAVLNYTGR